jgi:hypothetical protein
MKINNNFMKRRLLLTIAVVVLSAVPFYGQKFSVGITSGLNLSTLSEPGNIYDNEVIKTGFGGGIALRYAISNSFGLQSGIIYEQKGFRKKQDLSSGEMKVTGTYNYFTVPVLAEGSIPVKGNVRLYGTTGIYAGFKSYSENAIVLPENESTNLTSDDEAKSIDGGWVLGGGFQVPAGNNLLQIGFKYSLGLTEVIASSSNDRNKSVLLGVTLFF